MEMSVRYISREDEVGIWLWIGFYSMDVWKLHLIPSFLADLMDAAWIGRQVSKQASTQAGVGQLKLHFFFGYSYKLAS
jgi:hypothetical protein